VLCVVCSMFYVPRCVLFCGILFCASCVRGVAFCLVPVVLRCDVVVFVVVCVVVVVFVVVFCGCVANRVGSLELFLMLTLTPCCVVCCGCLLLRCGLCRVLCVDSLCVGFFFNLFFFSCNLCLFY